MKKLSESQLRAVIKQELFSVLNEAGYNPGFIERGVNTVQDFFGVGNQTGFEIKNTAKKLLDDEGFIKQFPSQVSPLKKIIAMGDNEASSEGRRFLGPVEEFYDKYLSFKAQQERDTKSAEDAKYVRDQEANKNYAARQAEKDRLARAEKERGEMADREEMERLYQTTAVENPNTGRLEYSRTRVPGMLSRAEEAEQARKARRKAYGT